ncbi:MAG: nitronate monooxygenase family protein [Phreatobacter sp.]|uniref:NAD(P)H-dependent flavin oxidoreductase n=1 Tax=Phreatobacter sp. TaxID=1966341 RepID=UPI00273512C7|nr:nitronate monooxygenase family protein [Phreatobacter sp.]MDP2803092.1 nitronate monooxygenase family protein [Phreatobacter sp.]
MPLDRRIQTLFGISVPIIQAPMAGAQGAPMAVAVSEAGGLGSLPGALLSVDAMRAELGLIRQRTAKPINLNFFCHRPPAPDAAREAAWRARLLPYYVELEIDPAAPVPTSNRAPFDAAFCAVVEEFRPEVVSFHFGLPAPDLMDRVKATGARVVSSATTADEARWLEDHGADAVIAQGYEAGGHRGIFLTDDVGQQPGLFALLPQVVDAVEVPVIAAGGIADARGIVAAFALGASAVQIGTAYLFTPEATITPMHREALREAKDDGTALTNLFTGRPARGLVNRLMREVGPLSTDAPAFPTAGGALMPLKAKAEAAGSADFSSLWAGQAASLGREMGAGDLTRTLWSVALERLRAG